MKITKSQLQKIIKEELDEMFAGYSSGGHPSSSVRGSSYGSGDRDRVEMKKLQTMLYRLEDDFLPFLMNSEEKEIGGVANQLYKLLKARVEGPEDPDRYVGLSSRDRARLDLADAVEADRQD